MYVSNWLLSSLRFHMCDINSSLATNDGCSWTCTTLYYTFLCWEFIAMASWWSYCAKISTCWLLTGVVDDNGNYNSRRFHNCYQNLYSTILLTTILILQTLMYCRLCLLLMENIILKQDINISVFISYVQNFIFCSCSIPLVWQAQHRSMTLVGIMHRVCHHGMIDGK